MGEASQYTMLCNECGSNIDVLERVCDQCGAEVPTAYSSRPPLKSSREQYKEANSGVTDRSVMQSLDEPVGTIPNEHPGGAHWLDRVSSVALRQDRKKTLGLVGAGVAALLIALLLSLSGKSSNKGPMLQGIEVDKGVINSGDNVTLTARVIALDDDQLSYEWSASEGRITGDGKSITLTTSDIDTISGQVEVKVSLTIKDSHGRSASADQIVKVLPTFDYVVATGASSPLVVRLEANQKNVRVGETINFTASVTGGYPGDLAFDWKTSDGAIQANGNTALLQTSSIQLSGDSRSISVTLTVKDGSGAAQTGRTTVNVVKASVTNWPPTLTLRASRTSVQQGEDVEITGDSEDRDGDALTYSWTHSTGQLVGSGNRVTLKTSATEPGPVEVSARVNDRLGQSAVDHLTITVTPRPNRSPSILSLRADSYTVRAGDAVTLRARASDADNDNLTYSWSSSTGSISGNGPAATLNTPGTSTGIVTVLINVSDQRGGTASEKISISLVGDSLGPKQPEPPRLRTAGHISASLEPEGESAIAVLSGRPGTPISSSGTIVITIGGGASSVTGYFPAVACSYTIASKENTGAPSLAELPGPGNGYSRMRVRVRPKNTSKPVRVTINWSLR